MVNIVNALVVILIAVSLLPTIITTISGANFTGVTGTIMSLIPLFLAIGVMIAYAPKMSGKK